MTTDDPTHNAGMDERLEIWAQALAVPAIIHVDPNRPVQVLTIGPFAQPAAKMALRYPSTVDVRLLDGPVPSDRRAQALDSLDNLPEGWRADLAAVGVPGDPSPAICSLYDHLAPEAVLVVGVDAFQRGREVREVLRQRFRQVLPYREHAPSAALFFLASNKTFGRPLRPLPPRLIKINSRYLDAMFLLASNEVRMVYGQVNGMMGNS